MPKNLIKILVFFWLFVCQIFIDCNTQSFPTNYIQKTDTITNKLFGKKTNERLLKNGFSRIKNFKEPKDIFYAEKTVPYGDDVSYGPIYLKDDLILNGQSYNGLFINTNGFVSFEHSDLIEAVDLNLINKPTIAVLLNDFDTKLFGSVTYQEITNPDTLDVISSVLESELGQVNQNQTGIRLTSALSISWNQVPVYGEENIYTQNVFQLVLATEANCSSYSMFFYQQIDLGTLTNFTIGLTSGDGYFVKQVDQTQFLSLINDPSSDFPVNYVFRLSDNEPLCIRNDNYDMYPFGLSNGDQKLPRGDDVSYGPIFLNGWFSFYGQYYYSIYINTNGFVSFEFNEMFEPAPIDRINKPAIAVLYNDFDSKRRGNVFYSQTQNTRILNSFTNDVFKTVNESPQFTDAVIITWNQIPTYGYENIGTKNTFQMVVGAEQNGILYGLLIYKNVELGTKTNFTIGITSGSKSYASVELDGLIQAKFDDGIVKAVFKIDGDVSQIFLQSQLTSSPDTSSLPSQPIINSK